MSDSETHKKQKRASDEAREMHKRHKLDLKERQEAWDKRAAKYWSEEKQDYLLEDEDHEDPDEEELHWLRCQIAPLEYGTPRPENCTTCMNGTLFEDLCDDCMCGGCGSEKADCGGC